MFHYIVLLFLVPLIISLLIALFKQCRELTYVACNIFLTNIIGNVVMYLNYEKSIINITDFVLEHYMLSIGCSILCGFITYYAYIWMKKKDIYIFKKSTILCGFVSVNLFVYFSWLLGETGRQSFDNFLYNFYTPINSDVANFNTQISALLFFMILMSACFLFFMRKEVLFKVYYIKAQRSKKRTSFAFSILLSLLLLCTIYPLYSFHLEDAYAYFNADHSFMENHYVDPNDVSLTWPDKPRNLIYIFMESFESSSFSKELGGLNEVNLLPNLTKHMQTGISFSNHDENLYGGMLSMPQTTVTLSGMITALSGVNNQVPLALNRDTNYTAVPNITTLHDLLATQGYQEVFMIGTTADGYHIGTFHRAHGSTKTIGWQEKIAAKELPEDYKVWWGFEDKKLYEFAKKDVIELAQQDQPFYYTISTNDTHRIDGYTDPSCPLTSYSYPMQNAIACADYMVNDFIEWLKEQSFYENTTVVIVGDHRAHSEEFVSSLSPQEERRIFNLILNSKSPETTGKSYNRKFWTADLYPTVLSSLGVKIEGNRLGLGVNLFADEPTLIEQYGEEEMSQSLLGSSPYYVQKFVLP